MVHPHEGGSRARLRHAGDGAQGPVELEDQPVHIPHAWHGPPGILAAARCLTRVMNLPLLALLAFLPWGCASDGRHLRPGESDAAAVRKDMGSPAEVLPLPQGGEVWFYPKGLGRQTFRVELGPDGRLRGVDQVLEERHFDAVGAGSTTREQLRLMLGPPFLTWRTASGETVWEYRYAWGAREPWTLRVGIGPDGVVSGQIRMQELDAGPQHQR